MLKERGWEEPIDETNVDLPDGWYHGAVVNTGGGIYNRVWRTTEDWNPSLEPGEEFLEVAYDSDFRGATLRRYEYSESYGYEYAGQIENIEADEQTDSSCAELARELMQRADVP